MREQRLDPYVRYTCTCCGLCCRQPWRVVLEPDKLTAIASHDWSRYPRLAGCTFYREVQGRGGKQIELAKADDGHCIFLDDDNLCIIHKELGEQAKPTACLQLPFFPGRMWDADYVSASYGCRAVQEQTGKPLSAQQQDIARHITVTNRPAAPDALVALDRTCRVNQATARVMTESAMDTFDPRSDESVWARYARVLELFAAACAADRADLVEAIRGDSLIAQTMRIEQLAPFEERSHCPMPARFLLAANLMTDAAPQSIGEGMSVMSRLAMVPRLWSLAQLRGVYASRLLRRNIALDPLFDGALDGALDEESTTFVCRYARSRFWQFYPCGSRLPMLGGLHQMIVDFNTAVLFARSQAVHDERDHLSVEDVKLGVQQVEFHVANQVRLYDVVLRGWLHSVLNNPTFAMASLRLMCPATINAAAGVPA
jgi:Fe-S-cluster containining protein